MTNYWKGPPLARKKPFELWNAIISERAASRITKLFFLWSFSSHSKNFHSFGDVTIAGEGLQILTYAQSFCPLSSGSSLACHTYCDMGHPSSPRTCDTLTLCRAFGSWAVTACFYDLGLSRLGFEHPTFRLPGQRCATTL